MKSQRLLTLAALANFAIALLHAVIPFMPDPRRGQSLAAVCLLRDLAFNWLDDFDRVAFEEATPLTCDLKKSALRS
jgi:hypothetical protein